MARRIPPLNWLRTFETAARHLSFTRAAEELNVTQAAVSHQVKALEARLGLVLFRRLNRALILTEDGQAYLPPVRDAFDAIAQATRRLEARQSGGVLTVSTMDSFAAAWLVPRLGRFRNVKRGANAIAARPATVRAYEIGKSINTTPTVTEDSKTILFGQTGEKRAA